MTAIWIAIAVLAVVVAGLTGAVYTLNLRAEHDDEDNCQVFEALTNKLCAVIDAHNGVVGAINWLTSESLDTSAPILEHLGLEIQEPTTTTTPRRLVPKVGRGEG